MDRMEETEFEGCLQLFDAPGAEVPEGAYNHLIVSKDYLWKKQVLLCKFMINPTLKKGETENPATPRVRHLTEHYARLWERWANIKLKFVDDDYEGKTDIRITLIPEQTSHSYVGTVCSNAAQNRPTMNQATLTDTASLTNFYRKVVHEFGHTLGCQHEQFSMNHTVRWNKEAMYAHYAQQDWSRDTVDRAYNYWQPPDPKYFVASRWDKESIMHYPIYKDWTFDNVTIGWNNELSQTDKEIIGKMYPFSHKPLPSGPGEERVCEKSAFASVNVYDYADGKMYLNLFCQTESSRLYRLTHLYRYKDPKILDSDWEATCIDLPLFGADAPAPETPLAAITHTYSQRLFYLDRENYIREIVWSFGKIQSKSSLGIKAATFSKLSAVRWRCDEIKDKLVEQIRVYYQLESGAIQEHSGVYTSDEKTKTGTTKWCKGKTLNFSGEVDGKALPGTDLSFVNLHVDKPAIRGYWQTTENTIREVYSDSKSWGLSHWAQFEFETPYATSLAATVWDWAGKNPKPVLYLVQTDSANDLRSIVVKTTPGNNQHKITAVGNQEVNKGSRLGIVDSDAGLHVFASNKAGIVIRKALPKKPFGSPQTLKLSWDSTLGFGPVGKW